MHESVLWISWVKIQNQTDEGSKISQNQKNMPLETGLENSETKPLQLAVFPLVVQACDGQQETFNYVIQTFLSLCHVHRKAAMQSNL